MPAFDLLLAPSQACAAVREGGLLPSELASLTPAELAYLTGMPNRDALLSLECAT